MGKASEKIEKVPKTLVGCDVLNRKKRKVKDGGVGYLQLMQ